MTLNQTCPFPKAEFLSRAEGFWKSVAECGYGSGHDQSFLATWKSCLDGVNREIKGFSGADRLQMVRLSRLAFCTLPEVERDFQKERATLFERVDDEGFWKSLVEGKIRASIERFLENKKPALQSICKLHLNYLSSLPKYQKREQNVLLLEAVQRANLRAAALVEEIEGSSIYNFRAIAERFQSSLIPQVTATHRELHVLLQDRTIRKYQGCCESVQKLSLQVQEVFGRVSGALCNFFQQADMGPVWKEKQEKLMNETMTFLFETLGKASPLTYKKLLEQENPKTKIKCLLHHCGATISIKTRVFKNNKNIYHVLKISLQEQALSLVQQNAYIKFRKHQSQVSRAIEITAWQLFLRDVPNILPMTSVTKMVGRSLFYKGALTPWCREGDMHDLISSPQLMAMWPRQKRVACLLQIAWALKGIHDLGYLYMDLKSANILRQSEDRVLLTDFGSTVKIGSGPYQGGQTTRGYTPPEQFSSNWVPYASGDWWSFGLVVVEFLYGIEKNKFLYYKWKKEESFENPKYFSSMKKQWERIRNELVKDLHDKPEIISFISRLLSIDPAKRPKDDEVIRELRNIYVNAGEGLRALLR